MHFMYYTASYGTNETKRNSVRTLYMRCSDYTYCTCSTLKLIHIASEWFDGRRYGTTVLYGSTNVDAGSRDELGQWHCSVSARAGAVRTKEYLLPQGWHILKKNFSVGEKES
jgi:hypothetical protein